MTALVHLQAQLRQRLGDDDATGAGLGQSGPLRTGWSVRH